MKPVFDRLRESAHSLFLLPKHDTQTRQDHSHVAIASENIRDGFGHSIPSHPASGNVAHGVAQDENARVQEMPVTLSGTVVRNGSRFALRETEGVLYTLDSTGRAWPFEGEDVRVTGKLNSSTRLLHIDAIESRVA